MQFQDIMGDVPSSFIQQHLETLPNEPHVPLCLPPKCDLGPSNSQILRTPTHLQGALESFGSSIEGQEPLGLKFASRGCARKTLNNFLFCSLALGIERESTDGFGETKQKLAEKEGPRPKKKRTSDFKT